MVPSLPASLDLIAARDSDSTTTDSYSYTNSDLDCCYDNDCDSTTGFGTGSHIYGGLIYSDSNGMQGIDGGGGDIYGTSPLAQSLASLPSYVPDIEQPGHQTTGFLLDTTVATGEPVIGVTEEGQLQYHSMSSFHMGDSHAPGGAPPPPAATSQIDFNPPQWNNHHQHPDDVVVMTSSHQQQQQPGAFLTPNNLIHHHLTSQQQPHHPHVVHPHLSPENEHLSAAAFAPTAAAYYPSPMGGGGPQLLAAGHAIAAQTRRGQQATSSKKQQQGNKPQKPKGTPGRKVKVPDSELTPQEARKRHIRRERNKVAAAKCRNRRRDLTESLQGEVDVLTSTYHTQVKEQKMLLKLKEDLEMVLRDHEPHCRLPYNNHNNGMQFNNNEHNNHNGNNGVGNNNNVMTTDEAVQFHHLSGLQGMGQLDITDSATVVNTPVCTLVTPSHINNTPIFTFPATSSVVSASTNFCGFKLERNNHHNNNSGAGTTNNNNNNIFNNSFPSSSSNQQSCSAEHRQRSSSSSGDSIDSTQSPTLLHL